MMLYSGPRRREDCLVLEVYGSVYFATFGVRLLITMLSTGYKQRLGGR